jgi:DNA-binding NarL/FixJ family response regulator
MSLPGEPPVRVLVVDDESLVRSGFRMILDSEPDLQVVGEAADGFDGIAEAQRLRPDVVLMDIRMPRLDGVAATQRLTEAGFKVLILTTFDLDEYLFTALKAGASGFLLKAVPPDDLIAAVRAVARGDALVEPRMTRRLIDEFARAPGAGGSRSTPDGWEQLTEREVEVFQAMARGLSNAEIASELYISETTVKSHVAHVLMKLALRDRVQAVVLAYESGVIAPGTT